MSKAPKGLRLWHVTWEDSTGNTGGWLTREAAVKQSPLECHTVGRLIQSSRSHCTFAGSWCLENDTVSDITVIPTKNIREWRRLKWPSRSNSR